MKDKIFQVTALILSVCLIVSGCGKTGSRQSVQSDPNESITYEKGKDFVGVIKSADVTNKRLTFYNTDAEKEVAYEYTSGTEILTKNEKQISSGSLEVGQVVDVYINAGTNRISKLQLSPDILEYENVKNLVVNADEGYIEINNVRYRYGSGLPVFSLHPPERNFICPGDLFYINQLFIGKDR